MANKTIPQLVETTTLPDSGLIPVDNGVQTFKMRADNLGKSLAGKAASSTILRGSGNYTVPAGVSSLRISQVPRLSKFLSAAKNSSNSFTVAMARDGTVYSWGQNNQGRLGHGDVVAKSSPVAVINQTNFVQFVTGGYNCFFLDNEGHAYAVGNNQLGQIGDGTQVPKSSPTLVVGGLIFEKIVPTGSYMAMAIQKDGTTYSWGQGGSTSGRNTSTDVSSPVLIAGSVKFSEISVSGLNVIARSTNDDIYSWGDNSHGQFGNGGVTSTSSPTAMTGSLTKAQKVKAGTQFAVFIDMNGVTRSLGKNDYGQLGIGNVTSVSTPTIVLGGHTFIDIAAGSNHVLGLKADGTVYAWGANFAGQLGLGNTVDRSSPILISGHSFTAIAVGSETSFGMKSDGNIYAWGENPDGELGVGDIVSRSTPTLVTGGLNFKNLLKRTFQSPLAVTHGQVIQYDSGSNSPYFGELQWHSEITDNAFLIEYWT
jgi:hypothetical protein